MKPTAPIPKQLSVFAMTPSTSSRFPASLVQFTSSRSGTPAYCFSAIAVAYLFLVRFMRVSVAKLSLTLSALLLAGCYADRYQWNLAHATVTANPALSRHDIEAITRLVTRSTLSPIVSIVRNPDVHGSQQVSVIAAETTGPVDEFILEKMGTEWHITSHEQSLDR
jgi:hypothetical protein